MSFEHSLILVRLAAGSLWLAAFLFKITSAFAAERMRLFLFLSRIAFVCNLFFLPVLLLHFVNYLPSQVLQSVFIVIGYFMAVIINPLVNLCCLIFLLLKRNFFTHVPKWLVLVNFIFLLLQIGYILLLNNAIRY